MFVSPWSSFAKCHFFVFKSKLLRQTHTTYHTHFRGFRHQKAKT